MEMPSSSGPTTRTMFDMRHCPTEAPISAAPLCGRARSAAIILGHQIPVSRHVARYRRAAPRRALAPGRPTSCGFAGAVSAAVSAVRVAKNTGAWSAVFCVRISVRRRALSTVCCPPDFTPPRFWLPCRCAWWPGLRPVPASTERRSTPARLNISSRRHISQRVRPRRTRSGVQPGNTTAARCARCHGARGALNFARQRRVQAAP